MSKKTFKQIKKMLLENDWEYVRTNGSHEIYKNKRTGKTVPIKCTKKDIPSGTVSSIERITGLKF